MFIRLVGCRAWALAWALLHKCPQTCCPWRSPPPPLPQIIEMAMNDKKDKLWPMLEKLNILSKLKSEDKELVGESPFHCGLAIGGVGGGELGEELVD